MTATLSAPTRERTPLTLDEERTAHELLDSLPPSVCEWEAVRGDATETCDEAATWLLLLSCGHSFGYCESHMVALSDYIDAPPPGVACRATGHPVKRVTHEWRPLDV